MNLQNHSRGERSTGRRADWSLIETVLRGLQSNPRQLSPTYLYDQRGSELFDQICELPEYYVTRTETRILRDHAASIASHIPAGALLVEPGSGASTKTRLLLDRLPQLAGYVPVDISRSHLLGAARRIANAYPHLEVLPVCSDFTHSFALPQSHRPPASVVVFFPGSTIGNFDAPDAVHLLRTLRAVAGPAGALLIGYDLVKDPRILRRAYNDAAGVTAQFNLNVLTHLNRELGASFDVERFRHEAVWVAEHSRIEMHLVSIGAQQVTLAGQTIRFEDEERLVTEHCHKYSPASFARLAAAAGWTATRTWSDELGYFNLQYLQ